MPTVAKRISLAKHRVNVSASLDESSKDSSEFSETDLNQFVGAVAQTLLSRKAKLVFGHDFRPGGVMSGILRIAQAYHPLVDPRSPVEEVPLITACVAWPDEPYADSSELGRLRGILAVEQVAVPTGLPAMSPGEGRLELQQKKPDAGYLRARALTQMRHHLTEICTARICLGGKRSRYSGRAPGIVEEAWMSLEAGKPLYLSSLLGGVTSDLIAAVTDKPAMPAKFCEPDFATADQYRQRKGKGGKVGADDQLLEPKRIWRTFADGGVAGLAKNNGLTEAENRTLFQAVTLDEVMRLVVKGLANVRPRS